MIFNQYVWLGAVGVAMLLALSSFGAGHHWATTKAEAERAKQADQYTQQLQAAIKRGNEIEAKLAVAESRVVTRTVEVIKHVPQVTTGTTPCLSSAAVSLLNQAPDSSVYPATSKPDGESSAEASASDRDIAYWIAEANRQYEIAAARLNALIEFNQGANP